MLCPCPGAPVTSTKSAFRITSPGPRRDAAEVQHPRVVTLDSGRDTTAPRITWPTLAPLGTRRHTAMKILRIRTRACLAGESGVKIIRFSRLGILPCRHGFLARMFSRCSWPLLYDVQTPGSGPLGLSRQGTRLLVLYTAVPQQGTH